MIGPAEPVPELGQGAAHHVGAAEQAVPVERRARMPACSTGRSEFCRGRRRRPLPENQTSDAVRPRRECPRSGSIGVKHPQSMASPRSRLVTWSYTHLSFHGRRFWRPHPDLDRAATPALPPGGGRPLSEGQFPCSSEGRFHLLAAVGTASAPYATSPGASPRRPRVHRCAPGARGGCRGLPGILLRPFLAASQIQLHRFKRLPVLAN